VKVSYVRKTLNQKVLLI